MVGPEVRGSGEESTFRVASRGAQPVAAQGRDLELARRGCVFAFVGRNVAGPPRRDRRFLRWIVKKLDVNDRGATNAVEVDGRDLGAHRLPNGDVRRVVSLAAGITTALATHTGRRSVVTSLYSEGEEALEDIAKFVGHARPSTTAGYVKRLGRRPKSVADRAAALLDPRRTAGNEDDIETPGL